MSAPTSTPWTPLTHELQTADGKPRRRVYLACIQCRARKTKCDGAKPNCRTCIIRANDEGTAVECTFPMAPKRRGPDKAPGTRQRGANKKPRAKATANRPRSTPPALSPSLSIGGTGPAGSMPTSAKIGLGSYDADYGTFLGSQVPFSGGHSFPGPSSASHTTRIHGLTSQLGNLVSPQDAVTYQDLYYNTSPTIMQRWRETSPNLPLEPSMDFPRKTWWDALLSLYCEDRASSARQISLDLKSLFEEGQQWLGFINVPLFYSYFHHPPSREKMQPSLVLAALCYSTFLRSSEAELGYIGRKRAMWLREAAQSALEASMNAGWVDLDLAMAAWLMVLFEISAHPYHAPGRSTSAMLILEAIIQILRLTEIDIDDPRTSRFVKGAVPTVAAAGDNTRPSVSSSSDSSQVNAIIGDARNVNNPPVKNCACTSRYLSHLCPSSKQLTPLWATTPGWHPDWTLTEIRKEQGRRLCWNTMILAASINSDWAPYHHNPTFMFLLDPSNYALLFPGEALLDASAGKVSVWALYARCMLLFNACILMRNATGISDNEKASFAMQAWIETIQIEDGLDRHACMTERATLYHGREYLFNTRMCISWEFSRYIPSPETGMNPIFNRPKAVQWLNHQNNVAQQLMRGMGSVTGLAPNILSKRPLFVWWFMSQAARALKLWTLDKTLLVALDVCVAFLVPIEYLTRLWPCPMQRIKLALLQHKITDACIESGIPPPPQGSPLEPVML